MRSTHFIVKHLKALILLVLQLSFILKYHNLLYILYITHFFMFDKTKQT